MPNNVAEALDVVREYIRGELEELDSQRSVSDGGTVTCEHNRSAAEIAKIALAFAVLAERLSASVAASAAKRDDTELQAELRGIDAKYELRKELRDIDNQHRVRAELQAELRGIDGKYELHKELRAIDDKYGLEPGPRPYLANHKADVARRAQIASWQLKQELRDIDRQYRVRAELQAELRGIDAKYELRKELRDIDNQHRVRAELQAELRGIDGKYELHKELRAIDYKYELQICLQRAHSAVAAADGSRYKLVAELGANHAAVKTVSACCNLARALVGLYGSVHTLTTLGRPETVVEDNAYATGLADQALLYALEAIFHLSDYQGRWVEDYSADAPGVFAAMAGVVMGDPSTFMTGVLTTPAQQAQGATR